MVSASNVFPDLGKSGLERLSLLGYLDGPETVIKKFWRAKPSAPNIRIEGIYSAGKKQYLRRLHIGFSPKRPARALIEIRKYDGQSLRCSEELTDDNFLAFCKHVCDSSSMKAWPFMLRTLYRFPYKSSLLLPFNPTPHGDQFVMGVKFGFSKNRSLHRLMVEKEEDQIFVSLVSKPIFRLDPGRLNSLFFQSVIRHANDAIAPLFSKPETKHVS